MSLPTLRKVISWNEESEQMAVDLEAAYAPLTDGNFSFLVRLVFRIQHSLVFDENKLSLLIASLQGIKGNKSVHQLEFPAFPAKQGKERPAASTDAAGLFTSEDGSCALFYVPVRSLKARLLFCDFVDLDVVAQRHQLLVDAHNAFNQRRFQWAA